MFNHSYKKLMIWQKAMQLAMKVYRLSRNFPKEEIYGLTSQIRRSALSVPSNIAEGSQRKSDKESAHFILISKGSLAEIETQFLLSMTFKYFNKDEFGLLEKEINELDKMLYSFHKSLTANSSPKAERANSSQLQNLEIKI